MDFADEDRTAYDLIVYSGPVDAYFGFRYGRLPYRKPEL